MEENNWQTIWNKRNTQINNFDMLSDKQIILELKRLNGYDVTESKITYEAFIEEFDNIIKYLNLNLNRFQTGGGINSVFEVGCGCGANLYYFLKLGLKVGGIDYSESLINILKRVSAFKNIRECICDEAINMPTNIKYDDILSTSVFHYFYNLKYAESVLEKMLDKTRFSLGIVNIHDEDKKKDFLDFRRKLTPNYDERYKGLPKLFYNKEFFVQFAKNHNLKIEFVDFQLKGFWDTPYIYNCFMYKIN